VRRERPDVTSAVGTEGRGLVPSFLSLEGLKVIELTLGQNQFRTVQRHEGTISWAVKVVEIGAAPFSFHAKL
jgi:hypothetical protein